MGNSVFSPGVSADETLEKMVLNVSSEQQVLIIALVDKILDAKCTDFEKKVSVLEDKIVSHLYDL